MLNNKRQNYHHSKLPNLGEIVTVNIRPLQQGETRRKFIVESFNLCDSLRPYSVGIHLVNLSPLDNRKESYIVSGHYCEVVS